VGRAWIGTSLRPEEAAVAVSVYVVGVIALCVITPVLAFNAMWLLGILFDLMHHPPKWGEALGGLAMWLGWWSLVGGVIWFVRRKRAETRATGTAKLILAGLATAVVVLSVLSVLLGGDPAPASRTPPTPPADNAHDYQMADCAAHLDPVCLSR
jgi:hypothetical protein